MPVGSSTGGVVAGDASAKSLTAQSPAAAAQVAANVQGGLVVLSAITSRAALARPVRTVSSRSKPSPTLIGVLADAATRTTSFWTTTASPTRVCADEGVIPAPATRPIASNKRTQFRETISHRTIDAAIVPDCAVEPCCISATKSRHGEPPD